MKRSEASTAAELISVIGKDGLRSLAETYGGTRLFVPKNLERSQLTGSVGHEIADKLASRYGGDVLIVPLVRDLRARHYRSMGLSNAQIARKLGLTEKGIQRLLQRPPVQYLDDGEDDDDQFDMFQK